MAQIVQERFVSSTNGNGTVHDLPFTNPVTPGNTILCLFFASEDVTGATVNGMAGSPAATEDASETPGDLIKVYRYTEADGDATGFRLTTATSQLNVEAWIVEVEGLASTSPFIAIGLFPPDFEPVELDATAAVNAAGDFALARFRAVTLANITSTRSGFTQSSESAGSELLQYNENTSAGTVTAGASLSANTGFATSGFVVTYKSPFVPDPYRGPPDPRAVARHRRRPKGNGTIGAPVAMLQGVAITPASVLGLGNLWPPATSGQTISVLQASEQDLAQPIAWAPKRRLVVQASESDLAQAITRRKTVAIAQALETDLAQVVVVRKTRAIAQALETDLAQTITRFKVRAVAQALETDLAQAVTTRKVRALAQAAESDLAQSVTSRKTRAVSQAQETDQAQTVSARKAAAVAQAAEQDAAQVVASRKLLAISQAAESDAAQTVASSPQRRLVAQAQEQDTAQAVAPTKARTLAQVQETDAAQSVASRKTAPVGQASEQDTAQEITRPQAGVLAQAQEQDLAQAVAWQVRRLVTAAQEADTSQAVSVAKALAVAQVQETDAAQPLTASKRIAVGRAAESDTAQNVTEAGNNTVAVAQASEQDSAQPVASRKALQITQAQDQEAAQPIARTIYVPAGMVFEIDTAQAFSWRINRLVATAQEQDEALGMDVIGPQPPEPPTPPIDFGGFRVPLPQLPRKAQVETLLAIAAEAYRAWH